MITSGPEVYHVKYLSLCLQQFCTLQVTPSAMSRIVVTTDFSPNALHAAQYAAHLFGEDDVTYAVVHAHFDPGMMDPATQAYTPELVATAQEGLRAAAGEFVERTEAVSVEQQFLLGPLPDALDAYVEEKGADAVVMGTKGRSGASFFGSNTSDVIRASSVPVIAVPIQAQFGPIRRILLADDREEMLPASMAMLVRIAKQHKAEVLIAHLLQGGDAQRSKSNRYSKILADIPHSFIEPHAIDVVEGLIHNAHRHKADMIAILHRHIGFLGRLLHPSVAKELAMETDLPLLVLEQDA